jgi:hypothetical protein
MNTPAERVQAALTTMLEGKILFQQTRQYGCIRDSYLFRVPGTSTYCVMRMDSLESEKRITEIACNILQPGYLLKELGGTGAYHTHEEISISSGDAQRILAMFSHWTIINSLRFGLIPQLPDPESDGDIPPTVQYL